MRSLASPSDVMVQHRHAAMQKRGERKRNARPTCPSLLDDVRGVSPFKVLQPCHVSAQREALIGPDSHSVLGCGAALDLIGQGELFVADAGMLLIQVESSRLHIKLKTNELFNILLLGENQ